MIAVLAFVAFSIAPIYAFQKNLSGPTNSIIKQSEQKNNIKVENNGFIALFTGLVESFFSKMLPPVETKPVTKTVNKSHLDLRTPAKNVMRTLKRSPGPKQNVRSSKSVKPAVMEGVDYSWGYNSGYAQKLKAARKHFVMRYVYTGEGKEITASEVKELKKAGLGIGIVFEITRDHGRALSGYRAGQQDARISRQYIHDAGLPSTMPVYFAVDFDANQAQQKAINEYLKGAASVLGKDKVGVYGGYYTVARALNAGVVKYAWQTHSWSYGKWDPRAQIRQYKSKLVLDGVNVDLNKTVHGDNGVRF